MTNSTTLQPLKSKLLTMMVMRAAIALGFLGITTWFQISEYSYSRLNLYPLYALVIAICVLTIFYSAVINRVKNLTAFTYIQVALDVVLITAIVYVTGGIQSYLSILYFLSVIGASILLGRRGGFYAAGMSSISYGMLLEADYYRVIPIKYKILWMPVLTVWEDVVTTIVTNVLAFFVVAYLTGYLAEKAARVEKALQEKGIDLERLEELNRRIVENIASGIMTLDEDSRITSFNMAAERITGYTLREVYSKDAGTVFPGLLTSPFGRSRTGMMTERVFKRKDSIELYLGLTVSEGAGGEMARIVIFQDLTRLKSMEEQLRRDERLKALGELSAGIAHEIRNPLAAISGSIQVLKGGLKLAGEDGRLMEIVVNEAERLNSLITDFLLFAKPAHDVRENINLSNIIAETVRIFSNSPQAAGISIMNKLNGGLFTEGDERQISQVFWNIFLNAAQAMNGGGVITLRGTVDSEPPHKKSGSRGIIDIHIEDTGEGIEPENIHKIFDPFFSTKQRGTGLGLAIAHRIVESHGGTIEVESAMGGGALFKVRLPRSGMNAVS